MKKRAGVEMAAAGMDGVAGPEGERRKAPPPELAERIAEVRDRIHAGFGQVVLAMMVLPRYRHLSIAELGAIVLDPLVRDRIAVASTAPPGENASLGMVGVAIWASVTEEADARIREQIKAGAFPIRLRPDDWNGGSINWLLDVIAPNERLATAVVANFKQVVKDGDLRLHPMVARSLNPETLRKLGAAPLRAGDGAPTKTTPTS